MTKFSSVTIAYPASPAKRAKNQETGRGRHNRRNILPRFCHSCHRRGGRAGKTHAGSLAPDQNYPFWRFNRAATGVIEPNALDLLYEHLGAPRKESLWLENTGHGVTFSAEREIAFQAIAAFIRSHSQKL